MTTTKYVTLRQDRHNGIIAEDSDQDGERLFQMNPSRLDIEWPRVKPISREDAERQRLDAVEQWVDANDYVVEDVSILEGYPSSSGWIYPVELPTDDE